MYEITYPQFDPVLIQIGPLAIRWYALAYIAGIIGGWRLALRMVSTSRLWDGYPYPATTSKRKHARPDAPITRDHIDDFLVWATFGVILGGRIGFVLFYNLPYYLSNPIEIFYVWQGGMAFHGGLAGVVVAIILFARSRGINMFSLGDIIATVAPLGYFFGRMANFINGELWGRAADVPWAMVFPRDPLQIARHPSQLYQAGIDGALLFAIMLVAVFRFGTLKRPGMTLGIFLTGYGCARFFTENFREPDAQLGYLIGSWLTMGMTLSLPMIVAGIWFIWRANTEPHLGHNTAPKPTK